MHATRESSRAAREPLETPSRASREPLRSRRLPRRAKPSPGAAATRRSDRAATLCLIAARRVLRRAACSRARVLTVAAPFVCFPSPAERTYDVMDLMGARLGARLARSCGSEAAASSAALAAAPRARAARSLLLIRACRSLLLFPFVPPDTTSKLIGCKGARCSCRRGAAANLAATLRLTRSRRARAAPLPLLIPRARRSLCLPCRCKEKQIRWRRLLLCCGGEEVCSPIVARRYGGSGRPNTDRGQRELHDRRCPHKQAGSA